MNGVSFSPTYLDRIVADVRERLEERRRRVPLSVLQARVRADRGGDRGLSFARTLRGPQVSLIAEVKRRSPSKGALRLDLDVGGLVEAYATAGAAAVSVLTEEDHFKGSLADLRTAVSWATLPVLRKDFIVDPYQVWETRACGASALLLIASVLSDPELWQLAELARELGLDVLLEVHDERELERALSVPEVVIGINNRDLRTFQVSLETTVRLAKRVPGDRLLVAESGISGRADVELVAQAGVDAVLVGEALLRETDPEQAARSLLLPPVPVVGRGVAAVSGEEDS